MFRSDGLGHYLGMSHETKYFERLHLSTADLFPEMIILFLFPETYSVMLHTDDFLNVSKLIVFFSKFYISLA